MKFLLRTWWAKVDLPWHLIQAHESYNFRLKGLLHAPADSKQIHYYFHVVVLSFATSALLMAFLAFTNFLMAEILGFKNHIFVVLKF